MLAPLLAAALAATAVEKPAPPPPPPDDDGVALLGVALDAGVPSGVGASLLVQPLPWLRLHGGAATNGAGAGVHAGLSFLPFRSFLTPTLTVEVGHFFEADATALAEIAVPLTPVGEQMLERFAYDYASAHLGLELGAQDAFVVYTRAGVAWIDARMQGAEGEIDDGVTLSLASPRMRALAPSAELGVAFFFL